MRAKSFPGTDLPSTTNERMRFRTCHSLTLLLLLVLPVLVVAQTTAPGQKSYKVLGIGVEGAVTTDPTTIILSSGIRSGDQIVVPGDDTRKAIQKLWNLKIFSDIQILIDREVGDGVFLTIRVDEYPRVSRIETKGNDEFDDEDLRGKIGLVSGQIMRPQDFDRIRRRITTAYAEEGYLLATVDFRTDSDTGAAGTGISRRSVLVVTVDEGPRVSIDRISFQGNSVLEESDLRSAMDETSENHWWKFWSPARFDRKKFEKDKELIVKAYRKKGYLDAVITRDSIWYSEDREHMYIEITVDEGSQSIVRNIIWKGNTVYPDSVLTERLGFTRGDIFNAVDFEENLRGNQEQTDVASLYLDNGYLRFYAQDERARVGRDSVDVILNVTEGSKSRIGHVYIRGNTKTHDKVVRRVLYTWPGDYFSRSAIIRSVRELATLNYFNPEKLRPEPSIVNDSTVDVIYNVEERSSDTFNASVGYSGTFGATGALGLTFNNFNIGAPFSGGAGQVLNFEWQFGEASRFRVFSLSFTEPWFMDTPTSVGFSLYDQRQQYNYDMRSTGASINLGRRFRWPDDFVRGDAFLRFQRLDVRNGGLFYDEGNYNQVSLTTVLSRNSLDSPIFPSAGSRVSYSIEFSGGFLPGNVNYHKHDLMFNWFTPLMRIADQNRLTLYTGVEAGLVKGTTSDPYIPPVEYFYMGGSGLQVQTKPLRGYEDRSIGPRVAGQITGGTIYMRYVGELRFAVTLNPMPLYVLAFAEAGNVWLNERFIDPFDLRRSAGFGARLLITGIGLIGFDYGYGFDDVLPKDGRPDGWHFHFQFGRGF
jgi:outer membrane protein insertion porin family